LRSLVLDGALEWQRRTYAVVVVEHLSPLSFERDDKGGLLPSHGIDGRRQYCSAAALTACALRPLDRWQIAALRGVLGADRDSGFRRLIDYVSA
jgi:hypothetical protein